MTGTCRRAGLIASIVAVVSLAGCAHRLAASAAGAWELRGAIVGVTDDHLAIRHKTGQIVDLFMDDRTVVMHDEHPQGREALRRGSRVRVEVEPLAAGGSVARVVRVYGGGS